MTTFWVVAVACLAVQVASQGCDPEREFECTNGFCIDKSRRCNGIFECLDFSDEDRCPVAKCKPGEFQCMSEQCIAGELRCDGNPDCDDKSDESGCVKILCHGHSFIYNQITATCLSCQHNTQGRYCDKCTPGYYGNPKVGTAEDCQPCSCNGHSTECDITGKCMNCGHNTEGEKCESCRPGFRGDATKGTPRDCTPNADPGANPTSNPGPNPNPNPTGKPGPNPTGQPKPQPKTCDTCNGHSTECDAAGKCMNCKDNTEGDKCEKCKTGYTGDATKGTSADCIEDSCATLCNKHATKCDLKAKLCMDCKDNTEGAMCEHCKEGFEGDATKGTPDACKAVTCRCNGHSDTCSNGVCKDCKDHTTGVFCEICEPGYYGKATGGTPNDCKKCPCPPRSSMCIELPGTAQPECLGCEDGYMGDKCEQCDSANDFVPLNGGPTAPIGCCVKKGVTSCMP